MVGRKRGMFAVVITEIVLLLALVAMPAPETTSLKRAAAAFHQNPSEANQTLLAIEKSKTEAMQDRMRAVVAIVAITILAIHIKRRPGIPQAHQHDSGVPH